MSSIIAYTFNAAAHCPSCTCNALACGTLTRRPPLACGTGDEHGVPVDAVDSEGNPVRPVFSTDEHAVTNCDRCGDPIGDDDGIPCDGCGATDAEPCGDPEGFAFCAACRAKDNDRDEPTDAEVEAF